MAQESQLAHRVLSNLALPYISNISPSDTEPHYVQGAADILTSVNTYAERRPGFGAYVETQPTVFSNLQRLFTWDRFDGTFIEMACDVNASGFAQVYKLAVGTDASFVSIFTDTSGTPFDFVVSNNTVYFANGNSAKKWDPINGLSNWGIAIGSVNNATGPNTTGNGVNGGGAGTAWTNPNNVTSAVNYATVSMTGSSLSSQNILCTQFGFAIPAANTITGIAITMDIVFSGAVNAKFAAQLLKNGAPVGTSEYFILHNTSYTANIGFGASADLWGTTWVPNDINQTTWGVQIQAINAASFTTYNYSVRHAQATIYALGGPSISVSGSAGSMTATAGYTYVFCYGNSNTGHISSPTPVSASTGVFTSKLNVSVTLTSSTDAQVNQIHVFRTTDGGGGTYFELPSSPYTNTSGAVTDNAADSALQIGSIAPVPTFNDPPAPIQGAVYFSGRIWGFTGNKVWFSGLEEISQGVPEESFPSGIAGNFWSFDEPVQALALAGIGNSQVLMIFCGGRIYGITGNTLDTFRRFLISSRRGCRNRACVSMMGGMVAWLDSANQVWASNGSELKELSEAIIPDLAGINQANCSLTFHTAGRFHWLVLSTGAKLFVYDITTDQWMPPWSFSASYLFSGETSPGNYVLMASNGTKALQMNPSGFNDNGVTYAPVLQTNLLSVIPDYGTRFSYIGTGSYNEPTRTGYPVTFQLTNNGQAISDFLICSDEDPTQATYISIAANLQDTAATYNRTNGKFLKQLVYPTTSPAARWISLKVVLANADQVDKIYELLMAYKALGGR